MPRNVLRALQLGLCLAVASPILLAQSQATTGVIQGTVTDPNGTIEVNVSNAQVSLSDGNGSVSSRGPPFAQLSGGSGEIDKKKHPLLSHISDALGYYVEYRFPVVGRGGAVGQGSFTIV